MYMSDFRANVLCQLSSDLAHGYFWFFFFRDLPYLVISVQELLAACGSNIPAVYPKRVLGRSVLGLFSATCSMHIWVSSQLVHRERYPLLLEKAISKVNSLQARCVRMCESVCPCDIIVCGGKQLHSVLLPTNYSWRTYVLTAPVVGTSQFKTHHCRFAWDRVAWHVKAFQS